MTMAHLCTRCGTNLGPLRAGREPHYGFSLVICPMCRSPWVRRQHPLVKGWRQARRICRAIIALVLRLLLLALMIGLTANQMLDLADLIAIRGWSALLSTPNIYQAVATLIGVPVATGIAVGFTLSHLRLLTAWASWGALFIGLAGIVLLFDAVEQNFSSSAPISFQRVTLASLVFLLMWVATLSTLPLGRVSALAYQRWTVKRTNALRDRLRRQRSKS